MVVDDRVRADVGIGRGAVRRIRADAALVFVIALAARLAVVVFSHGGPLGSFGYDGSVYYASADALTFGRLPYDDFVLLHPPALMLALTPFALLGRLTTDHAGFVAANTAFAVLGAINAMLVLCIARRMQLGRTAALLGGLFYAVWSNAIGGEYSIRLEPLGSCAFLCALLALSSTATTGRRRGLLFAGAALGVAASTKIWWIVPVLIVLVWQCITLPKRRALTLTAGVLAAGLAINVVFFLNAPAAMWQMVVADQLGRHPGGGSPAQRVAELSALDSALRGLDWTTTKWVLSGLSALVIVLCVAAWQTARCRLLVLVLAAQLCVLLYAPSYFSFYADYAAAAAALVLAGAAGYRVESRQFRPFVAVAAAIVGTAASLTVVSVIPRGTAVARFPGQALAAGVEDTKCVMADSPMALIELNALSHDFAHGCANWVDVTGRTYGIDAPVGRFVSRPLNVRWQRDLRRYLLSGQAVILVRAGTGVSAATRAAIDAHPVLEQSDGYTVYRVRPEVADN